MPQERLDDTDIPITIQQPPPATAPTDDDKRAAGDNLSDGSSEPTEKPDVTRFSFFEKNFGGEEIVISVKTSDSDDEFEEDLDEPKAQEEESQSSDDSKSSYRMPTF